MNLKTHTVYKEVQERNGFFIGRLYDGKGTEKYKIIEESKSEVHKALDAEGANYKRK